MQFRHIQALWYVTEQTIVQLRLESCCIYADPELHSLALVLNLHPPRLQYSDILQVLRAFRQVKIIIPKL